MDRPVNYEQTDRRWSSVMYSSRGDPAQTIGTSGCMPTCVAMVIATLRDTKITPLECCSWALGHGYRTGNDGTAHAYVSAHLAEYNIPCTSTRDEALIESALRKGLMVIGAASKGRWTNSGHIILAYSIDGDQVLINDPNSTAGGRERAPLSAWRAEVGTCWIIGEEWREMDIKSVEIVRRSARDNSLIKVSGVNISDENYIKLKDLAVLIPGVAVSYDADVGLPVVTLPGETENDIIRGYLQRQLQELR